MKILAGKHKMRLVIFCSLSLLITGCQPSSFKKTNKTVEHRVTFKQNGECHSDLIDFSTDTPPKMYQVMNSCIIDGHFKEATFLYTLAGSYTLYDAMKINTQYAHSMHNKILKNSLDQLKPEQKTSFLHHLRSTLSKPEEKIFFCQKVKETGGPNYFPSYMLISPVKRDNELFLEGITWDKAVDQYLECP